MATPIVYPASAVASPPALTASELLDEFVAMAERKPTTRVKYRVHLDEFVAWLEGQGLTLLSARRRDVARYLAYLKSNERVWHNSKKKPVQRPLGPSSRKGVLAALRAFYHHCAVMDYIAHDPTFGIEAPKVTIKRGIALTWDELRRFLDAPGTPRCHVQAYLEVYTAGRAGSLREILWQDVDFERNVIHLNAKFDNNYTLPMHPQLRAALLRWREEQREEAERRPAIAKALANPETAWVLLTRNGKQLSHTTLGKMVKWRAVRAGPYPHPPGKQPSTRTRVSSPLTPYGEASPSLYARRGRRSRTSPRSSTRRT